MKTLIISAVLAGALMGGIAAQQAPEPYPGQREHQEPPAGWWCVPADADHPPDKEAHACDCLGMIEEPICHTPETNEDGEPTGQQLPRSNDNAKCKVYCHKDHCLCERQCKDT